MRVAVTTVLAEFSYSINITMTYLSGIDDAVELLGSERNMNENRLTGPMSALCMGRMFAFMCVSVAAEFRCPGRWT
jgi:hypothetical protein